MKQKMKLMKLADFITQTVNEIIDGVVCAQEYAKGKGASVNPPHVNWSDQKQAFHLVANATGPDKEPHLTTIDFDILLTIGEDNKVQGGIAVFAASLGIGFKGEVKDYSEAANRIKFQILAKLPQQEG